MAVVGDKLTAAESGWQRFDNADAKLRYVGTWISYSSADYYSGAMTYSTTQGSYCTFSFSGTKLRLICTQDPSYTANAELYVDGVKYPISQQGVSQTQTISFSIDTLADTMHMVKLVNATAEMLTLDAIDISSTGTLYAKPVIVGETLTSAASGWKRVDASNTNVRYGTGWAFVSGYMDLTLPNPSRARFTFTGTKLRIISIMSTALTTNAVIKIDGVDYQFNTYAATQVLKCLVFEKFDIPDGTHEAILYSPDTAAKHLIFDEIDVDASATVTYPNAIPGDKLLAAESGWKRFDSNVAAIKYGPGWSSISASGMYGGSMMEILLPSPSCASFAFTGTKIRLIGLIRSDRTADVRVSIDGVEFSFSTNSTLETRSALVFEKTGLADGLHNVSVYSPDATDKRLTFDAVDIDTTGTLSAYNPFVGKIKTKISDMSVGDAISCEYTAASGAAGTFANLGAATKAEIPTAGTATPDGKFYFVMVGYDTQGNKKLVSDRVLRHTVSFNTLNSAGYIYGTNPAIGGVIRSMTSAVSSADENNEWVNIFKYGPVYKNDSNVWNNGTIKDITQTRQTTTNYTASVLGTPYNTVDCGTANATTGFRPVLIAQTSIPKYYLFVDGSDKAYRYDGAALVKVSDAWSAETTATKKTLFLTAGSSVAPISVLSALGKFKICVFSQELASATCSLVAVKVPKVLIQSELTAISSFEGIDKVTVTATATGGGVVKMAFTIDGTNFKAWNGSAWADVAATADGLAAGGMTPTAINALTRANMDALTLGKDGVGIAALLDISAVSDAAALDNIALQVDMKGAWSSALKGTDYNYGYPKNNVLRVSFLTAGDYLVNYSPGKVG